MQCVDALFLLSVHPIAHLHKKIRMIQVDHFHVPFDDLAKGLGILVAKNANGDWVNAVDLNTGTQTKRFVLGPELPSDVLGTYGIDPTTRTAWAVIDYNGSYAVSDHFMSWLLPLSLGD